VTRRKRRAADGGQLARSGRVFAPRLQARLAARRPSPVSTYIGCRSLDLRRRGQEVGQRWGLVLSRGEAGVEARGGSKHEPTTTRPRAGRPPTRPPTDHRPGPASSSRRARGKRRWRGGARLTQLVLLPRDDLCPLGDGHRGRPLGRRAGPTWARARRAAREGRRGTEEGGVWGREGAALLLGPSSSSSAPRRPRGRRSACGWLAARARAGAGGAAALGARFSDERWRRQCFFSYLPPPLMTWTSTRHMHRPDGHLPTTGLFVNGPLES